MVNPMYYDRQGHPIDMRTWGRLHADHAYMAIKQEEVGPYFVSTVWVGMDMRPGGAGAPVIFETMVFARDEDVLDFTGLDTQRYCTEDEAVTGHRQLVELILATTTDATTNEGNDRGEIG